MPIGMTIIKHDIFPYGVLPCNTVLFYGLGITSQLVYHQSVVKRLSRKHSFSSPMIIRM